MTNHKKEELRQLWISRLADLGDSGMTQDEWCKSRSIPYSRLRYWITKLRKESASENQTASWLKVDVEPGTEIATIRPPENVPASSPISIRFSEFTVDIPRGCHGDQLLEVLRALKAL